MTGKELNENSVAELLRLADEFDGFATRGSTAEAKRALEQLATRFRIFAARRAAMDRSDQRSLRPKRAAPGTGR
jgi:hypothetical protein